MQKRPKLWIAIPTYTHTIVLGTFKSLVYDLLRLVINGMEVKIFDEVGHADIYLARAQIVAHFLADPDATDLIMVDSDVSWDALGLVKLLSHDADLVAGAYPKREVPLKFMYRNTPGAKLMGDPETGLVEIWGAAGGFLRMKRAMLEKMVAHYSDELMCADDMVPNGESCRLFNPYFYKGEDGRRYQLSEDYAFCQRWRDIGGKVYLDVNIPMAHTGMTTFQGCLGHWPQEVEKAA